MLGRENSTVRSNLRQDPDGSPVLYASVPLNEPLSEECSVAPTPPQALPVIVEDPVRYLAPASPPSLACQALQGCCSRWRDGRFTINPEESRAIDVWDVIVITALFLTAVMLPLEVALITAPEVGTRLWRFDKSIDLIFMIDIVLNFNVAFACNDSSAHVVYVKDPLRIARNYMAIPFSNGMKAGWFWPDVITVIPWEEMHLPGQEGQEMESVRLVRVLRLVRMLRLVRVIKLFKRWHTYFGFSFAAVKIMRTVGFTILLVHWLACFWAHLGLHPEDYLEGATIEKSWISEIAAVEKVEKLTLFTIYSRALYFCTVVLTTVGFGDIVPHNSIEHIMMILTIFVTGLVWAWVVANVVDVINNSDNYSATFTQTMDDLNVLMSSRGVQNALKFRIRKHLYEAQQVHRHRHQLGMVTWLSESLQGELAVDAGMKEVLNCVWYLRGLTPSVVIELSVHFKPDLFSPNEFIMDMHSLYVIRKGTCIRRGALLHRDAVFGEDMILVTEVLKDTVCPRTLTFVEVMALERKELFTVCKKYPDVDRLIRKAQTKLALKRALMHDAARIRRAREKFEKEQGMRTSVKNAWDSNFFGKKKEEASFENIFKQERLGWVDSIQRSHDGSEQERKQLVQLTQDIVQLQNSVETMEQIRASNAAKLEALEKRVQQSQETTRQRLLGIHRRFDDFDAFMANMMRPGTPASPYSSGSK